MTQSINNNNFFPPKSGLTREIAGLTGRAESENEAVETAAETDNDSVERLHKQHQSNSFKRPTPVMGNRGLETRSSKRSHHSQSQKKEHSCSKSQNNATNTNSTVPSPGVTVGALEVQNVKRAINRYGTLPKGARIGAYLESLRHNEAGPPPGSRTQMIEQNGTLMELPPPPPALGTFTNPNATGAMSPRAVMRSQPQMIRSNSSSGVTMSNSATSSLNKLQRYRTATDGSMITFSSFRGTSGSPKRSFHPTLADLEFPPPPLDLPPPPEESESVDVETSSSRSNLDSMQQSQAISLAPSNDVSNTEPSVEEASSRFGVSLRKREPSTDSCSSLGSPAAATGTTPLTDDLSDKEKLEVKPVAEIKERSENKKISVEMPYTAGKLDCKNMDPVSQVVNELTEAMNMPKLSPTELAKKKTSTPTTTTTTATTTVNLAKTKNGTNTNNFKAQLKKVDAKKMTSSKEETKSIIDFKSRLRRVENNGDTDTIESSVEYKKSHDFDDKMNLAENNNKIFIGSNDMISDGNENNNKKYSKLNKKCDENKCMEQNNHEDSRNRKKSNQDNIKQIDINKTDANIDKSDEKSIKKVNTESNFIEEDDKRKSTGSISSLKKLWEAKESSSSNGSNNLPTNEQNLSQLSPKLRSKSIPSNNNNNNNNIITNNNKSEEESDEHSSSTNKKPAVPIKPTKLVSIYATPIQVRLTPDTTNNSTTPTSSITTPVTNQFVSNCNAAATTNNTSTTQISREGILELIQLLENSLKIPITLISASQWLQLSDKLNILQYSCVNFVDKQTMPPHSKFQFRELVTRCENQSRSLRSASSKNIQDNEKLVSEVGQTLKQISNAMHR